VTSQPDAERRCLAPVVYGYGNFAIGLDPKFFHKLHILSISENLKLSTPISNPNSKPTTQLHILAKIIGSVYFAVSQTQLVEVVT